MKIKVNKTAKAVGFLSLGEIVIKVLGIVLAVVGFALLLSVVGIPVFGVSVENIWMAIILGFVFLGMGIWLIRGGSISL